MKPNTGKYSKILKAWGELATNLEGLPIKILKSSSKELEEREGTIISETAKMLQIQTLNKKFFINKTGSIFEIQLKDGLNYVVEGDILNGLPDARIKKKLTSW